MKHYCCEEFSSAIEYYTISMARYPSGTEYFMIIKVQKGSMIKDDRTRIYYCPYCGKDLR